MAVTQQYLVGEVSMLLARIEAAMPGDHARDVARLRQDAETHPPTELRWIALRALRVVEDECWDAIDHGDTAAFARQADLAAELHDFGMCAGFLDND